MKLSNVKAPKPPVASISWRLLSARNTNGGMIPAASSAMRISATGGGQCITGMLSLTCFAAPIIAGDCAAYSDETDDVSPCKQLLVKCPRLRKLGVHFLGRDEIFVHADLGGNDHVEIGRSRHVRTSGQIICGLKPLLSLF